MLVGLAFVACGSLFVFVFGQSYTLDCVRLETRQFQCTRHARWLNLVPLGSRDIDGLSGAHVTESCDSDGCTYRVDLDTAEGPVALTEYYTSGYDDKVVIASRINSFVVDTGVETLSIKADAGLFGTIFPFIFVLVGLVIAVAGIVSFVRDHYG